MSDCEGITLGSPPPRSTASIASAIDSGVHAWTSPTRAPVSSPEAVPRPVKASASKKRKAPAKPNNGSEDEEGGEAAITRATKKVKLTGAEKKKLDEEEQKKKKKPRNVANQPLSARPLGRSYAECDEWDKQLLDMRDAGESWGRVREEWERTTGEKTATSTLPNRYSRLKTSHLHLSPSTKAMLIACKREVDRKFEKEKWSLVSDAMVAKGTEVIAPEVLARMYKKMMNRAEVGKALDGNDGEESEEE